MSFVYKMTGLMLFASSALFIKQTDAAACPKCVKIEAEREKQGPQPTRYYDDYLKDQISLADEDLTTFPRVSSTGSSVNTGATDPTSRTGVSGSTSASTDTKFGGVSSSGTTPPADSSGDSRLYHSDQTVPAAQSNTNRSLERETRIKRNVDRQLDVDFQRSDFTERSSSSAIRQDWHDMAPERSYSTIFVILNSGDFLKTLRGPFTLFIPSNEALRKLPAGTLQDLLRPENQELLSRLVGNHLVAEKLTSLRDKATLTTVNGKNLAISSQDGVGTVNGARIIRSQNVGDHGMIYIIDTILINR